MTSTMLPFAQPGHRSVAAVPEEGSLALGGRRHHQHEHVGVRCCLRRAGRGPHSLVGEVVGTGRVEVVGGHVVPGGRATPAIGDAHRAEAEPTDLQAVIARRAAHG